MAPRLYARIGLAAVTAALLSSAFGQAPAGGTPAPPATAPGTPAPGGNPGTPDPGRAPRTTTPSTQQPTQQPQQMPQPIFVSGRVLLEDGTPPTESVVMERVCNGQPRSEGYTDSKGYFSFELGRQNNGMLRDASENPGDDPFNTSSGFGGAGRQSSSPMMIGGSDTRFMGCELRARLVGYRSQVVSLAMRRPLDNPDIGVILLHRLGASEGGTVSVISLKAPKDAKKAYEKGLDLVKKNKLFEKGLDTAKEKKLDEALKSYEKAVELYPSYATAWYELGRLRQAKGDKDGAKAAFEGAIKGDPKFVTPYVDLAALEASAGKWQEVADITQQAVKLDPFDYPQAHFYNAVANYNLKNVEAAEKSAKEAERLDTRHALLQNLHLLGVILAQRQDFKGAAERFRSYLKFAPASADVSGVKNQLEQVEKFGQQTAAAPGKQ